MNGWGREKEKKLRSGLENVHVRLCRLVIGMLQVLDEW